MQMELPLGEDPDLARWFYDIICSLRPQIQQFNLSIEPLGDFDTLLRRMQAEVAASNSVASWFAAVGRLGPQSLADLDARSFRE